MALSVRLSANEEQQLEITARRLGRSKSDLARQAVAELCQRLDQHTQSPYELGKDLFGTGELALPPSDPIKKRIWEKLRDKHGRLG